MKKIMEKIESVLQVVFLSWYGEENTFWAWIKAIPFLLLVIPVTAITWVWEKLIDKKS